MERAIEIYAVLQFLVIGISHAIRPRVWIEFFAVLRGWGEAGVFAVGFLSLGFGSLIVSFHNVWSGIPLIVTILGWAQVTKGLIYFTFPAFGLRKLGGAQAQRESGYVVGGVVFLILAAILGYHLWTTA